MNNEEKIEAIIRWQESPYTHELTCGRNDCQGILTPEERDGEVVLVCYECNNYYQTYIPECIYSVDYKKLEEPYKILRKRKELMDCQNEVTKTVNWIKDYVTNAGVKGIVVGLSGGIDSSVIAWLSAQAVGKENVIGISLPCQTRKDMKTDAKKLAENLGIRFETIELSKSVGFLADGVKMTSTDVDSLVLANIKARLRMTALYAMAGANNYIVAGTGNLSELMVGYFTKFGDGGVDIEPIGNFYKTEVYQMAELMPEIPKGAITKAPSADLWDGQTDEEELGMTYAELDEILYELNNPNSSKLEKFDIEKLSKVQRMIRISEHKNNTPPRYEREKNV